MNRSLGLFHSVIAGALISTLLLHSRASGQTASPDIISLSAGNVELGIRYSVSGGSVTKATTSSQQTQIISTAEIYKNTRTTSQDVKRKVTQSLNLGFDLAKGLGAAAVAAAGGSPTEFGLTASKQLADSSEEDNDSHFEDSFTTSTSRDTKMQVEQLLEQQKLQLVSWGPKDGYISADVTLTNNSLQPVTVREIKYMVVELDGCGGKESRFIGDGYVRDANLVAQTIQSNTSSAASVEPPHLMLTIPPKRHYSDRLYVPSLPTDEILGILQQPGRVFDVRIVSYEVVSDGAAHTVFSQSDEYITVDLLDPTGRYSRKFVKADRPLTFHQILSKLGLGEVKLKELNGHTIVTKLDGKESTFTAWPVNTTNPSTDKGTWVAVDVSNGVSEDITGPIPSGSRLLLAYVTINDLLLSRKLTKSINLELPVHTAEQTNLGSQEKIEETIHRFGGSDDLLPVACTDKVNVGDVIDITLGSVSESHTIQSQLWKDVELDKNNLLQRSDAEWCGAQSNHFAAQEQSITPSVGLDPYNLSVTFDPVNKYKVPISLQQIVPSCSFHSFANSSVRFHFAITEQMLPEKSGPLCFVTPIQAMRGIVGRQVVPEPSQRGDNHDLWWARCGMWKENDPPRSETVFNYNQHHLEILLTQTNQK